MNETIYLLLIWSMPILLGVLIWIGKLGVAQLIKLSDTVSAIKIDLTKIIARHDSFEGEHTDLKKRVERIETHLYERNGTHK